MFSALKIYIYAVLCYAEFFRDEYCRRCLQVKTMRILLCTRKTFLCKKTLFNHVENVIFIHKDSAYYFTDCLCVVKI